MRRLRGAFRAFTFITILSLFFGILVSPTSSNVDPPNWRLDVIATRDRSTPRTRDIYPNELSIVRGGVRMLTFRMRVVPSGAVPTGVVRVRRLHVSFSGSNADFANGKRVSIVTPDGNPNVAGGNIIVSAVVQNTEANFDIPDTSDYNLVARISTTKPIVTPHSDLFDLALRVRPSDLENIPRESSSLYARVDVFEGFLIPDRGSAIDVNDMLGRPAPTGTVQTFWSAAAPTPETPPESSPAPSPISSGTITTIAGNGTAGFSGDGGSAIGASLNLPIGVAVDSSGNVYIVDGSNKLVRRVSTDGTISTFAGNSTASAPGNGGPATEARLYGPVSVAVDSWGNVYIAEDNSGSVRRVSTDGTISTFAGDGLSLYNASDDNGPATEASLGPVSGVAVDSTGNVYIATPNHHRIRRVSTSGIITTFAGGGHGDSTRGGFSGDGGPATAAALSFPHGVAADSSGNVHIADTNNIRVRRVSSSGIISTFAGNGSLRFSGDGGPATEAGIGTVNGVAVDSSGNMYIASISQNRVRRVSTDGTISTIAGNGSRGFSGDGGPATEASLYNPWGVTVDSSGNVYIADTRNHRIRRVIP